MLLHPKFWCKEDGDRLTNGFLGRKVKKLRAPRFQVAIIPFRSLLMMASSKDCTMAASCWAWL
jgi:hypothetical protein